MIVIVKHIPLLRFICIMFDIITSNDNIKTFCVTPECVK